MADPVLIYNSPYKTTQSWASQGAVLQYGIGSAKAEEIPLIVSGLTLTYTQQANPVYPLNTDGLGKATKINIKGAPQGTLQLQSIYSPSPKSIMKFLKDASRDCVSEANGMYVTIRPFGDILCKADNNTINNKGYFKLKGVELVSMGLNIQSGEVTLVSMPLNFTFTLLEMWDYPNTTVNS